MEEFKRILVVSRMTRYCRKAVHYGISLCQKYGAELYVIHVVYDPIIFGSWNLPTVNLEEEFKKEIAEAKKDLDAIIALEKAKGMNIKEIIKEGKPTEEILNTVKKEKIDLIVMLAHEEGHLEHLLFGRSNDEIMRALPCSILMLKQEPRPVAF